MNSPSLSSRMRDLLADLYGDEASSRRVVVDAGIDPRGIAFSTRAIDNWHAILAETHRVQRVDHLLDAAIREYGTNETLRAIRDEYKTHGFEVIHPFPAVPPWRELVSPEDHRNRQEHKQLRERVKQFWIYDVLRKSLYREIRIQVNLQDRQSAVDAPLRQIYRHWMDQSDDTIAPGTSIVDVYDRMGQMLLILGEPGSGKTTALLELANELLARTDKDEFYPTPVVLNLSSWKVHTLPIAKWIVEELNTLYYVDKSRGRLWLEKRELILLLDGLDEVKEEYREECVEAINRFHREYPISLVVCCRVAEYEALSVKLGLQAAVQLQPFDDDQITEYLNKIGPEASGLFAALRQDQELHMMATSPFMLNIMVLTYRGWPAEEILTNGSGDIRHRQLLDSYMRAMFLHRGPDQAYSPRDVLYWLRWLAARMVEHGQTVFLIERMQPAWLPNHRERLSSLVTMAAWGPVYGLLTGSLLGVTLGLCHLPLNQLLNLQLVGMAPGPTNGLLFGVTGGLFFGAFAVFVDSLNGGLENVRPGDPTLNIWVLLRNLLYVGLFWGMIYGIAFHLLSPHATEVRNALIVGLVGLLVGGLVAGFIRVKPARLLDRTPGHWNLRKLLKNLRTGLLCGLLVGAALGLLVGLVVGVLTGVGIGWQSLLSTVWRSFLDIWWLSIPAGLVGGLLFGLLFELDGNTLAVEPGKTQSPNQGIELSAQNALILLLSLGLLGLAIGVGFAPSTGELYLGLVFGLFLGLLGGLIGGADAVVKHSILRAILYMHGLIPRHYARFLDHCADLILLRKTGGGYLFIHRLLMEHIAEVDDAQIDEIGKTVESSLT